MFSCERKDADIDQSVRYTIGADEVGRGCLAGPVTVCAVLAPSCLDGLGVTDSKLLTPRRRVLINTELRSHPNVMWSIASVQADEIDQFGISMALRMCFSESINKLLAKCPSASVVIDGKPMLGLKIPTTPEYVVSGDSKVWAIGAASIIAKVWRDEYMVDESRSHPGYGFDENSGYGTQSHIDAIRSRGLTTSHRATFCRNFIKRTTPIEDLFGV